MRPTHTLLIMLALLAGPASAHGDANPVVVAPAQRDPERTEGHGAALGQPGDPEKVTRTVEIIMSDTMRFTPARIAVKKNETIRFVLKNTGQLKHEMVLGTRAELTAHAEAMRKFPEMEHDDPNAVSVEPGQRGELVWRFTRTGSFDFACLVPGHFEAGMQGKIAVHR